MTSWTSDELDKIGKAEELEIAALRPDGTLSGHRGELQRADVPGSQLGHSPRLHDAQEMRRQ
jgi:hypothetical protein